LKFRNHPFPDPRTLSIHKAEDPAFGRKIVSRLAPVVSESDADRPHTGKFATVKQKFADSG
jgi:hypothetical protein